ncbi:MAG: hypothetical protein IBX56_19865 [Methylomicrobium sp.]|nr:hypothetical protein [Methylomicrobium sp.]
MSLPNPGSPSARRQFTINGHRLANDCIENVSRLLTQGFDEVLTNALDSALAGEVVSDDLSKSLISIVDSDPNSHTLAALKSLMIKDVEYGAQQLKRLAFDIITMMSDTSLNNAIHGAVVKSIVGRHSYTQKNNKEWPTIRKARLLIRYHLLRAHNEAVLLIGMSKGERQFVVINEAQGHRYHGLEFTVDSGANLPWYHDIEATVFHPNSRSLVARRD